MKKTNLLLALLGVISLTGCSNKYLTLEQIQKAGKIIVTTNAEFAPFEFKEGNELKGIDIEIIKEFGKHINVEVEIQDVDFDSALLSVSNYKSDLAIAAITKNATRDETMDFSNSYYSANQVVIVKENSEFTSLTSVEDIISALSSTQAKIGCQRGTTGQYYIEGDEEWEFEGIANSECITYDSGALAVTALANGQIDAVIIDQAPASLYCKSISGVTYLDVILTEEEYAIAVAEGNDTLIQALNDFITKIKGDGTFDSIVSKYYAE